MLNPNAALCDKARKKRCLRPPLAWRFYMFLGAHLIPQGDATAVRRAVGGNAFVKIKLMLTIPKEGGNVSLRVTF